METYRYDYESNKIKDFLTGKVSDVNTLKNNDRKKEALKMVHVGFSRPTHLLCFAVREDRINKEEIDRRNEWDIIEV